MRRIAIINQKGGVGKTTTSANLGAALAEQGRRVVVVDMDPQANASLHLGIEAGPHEPSVYSVLVGELGFAECMRETKAPRLWVVPSNIDLSGAELELASAIGRDSLIRDAIEDWCKDHQAKHGQDPADYVIFDCPPSLGLLSINALAAAGEVLITLQTQFLALMGMSKLVEVVQLIRRRLNPELTITGIVPCLYDSRLKLNREVLGEVRKYFPGQVFKNAIRSNVKLAEAPSFGISILDYASESNGAQDYRMLALEVIEQETRDTTLAHLPEARSINELARERSAQQAAVREQEFSDRDAASSAANDDDESDESAADEAPVAKVQAPKAKHVEVAKPTKAQAPPKAKDEQTAEKQLETPKDVETAPTQPVTGESADASSDVARANDVSDARDAANDNDHQSASAATDAKSSDSNAAEADDAQDPPLREHVIQPTAPPTPASVAERAVATDNASPPVKSADAERSEVKPSHKLASEDPRAEVKPSHTHTPEPSQVEAQSPAKSASDAPRAEAQPQHKSGPDAQRVASNVRRSGAVEDELRILRAADLPQLPPEAFELPR